MSRFKKIRKILKQGVFIYRYFQTKKKGKLVPKERALARIGNMITLIEQLNKSKK